MDPIIHELLLPYFSFKPPGYYFAPLYKMGAWDGNIRLLKNSKVPAGLFLEKRREIGFTEEVKFRVDDQRVSPSFVAMPQRVERRCRPYQRQCVIAMQACARCGGLLLNATGTGKTFTAGAYFSPLTTAGAFVVDELTLLEQARAELSQVLGEPVGIIGNQQFEPERITVCTVQTLHKHRQKAAYIKWARDIETVFLDEIHTALNRRNIETVRAIMPLTVFGLTATLELNKAHIRTRATALAGPVVFDYPIEQGMDEGHLSSGVVCAVDWRYDGLGGDYQHDYEGQIVRSKSRNNLIEQLVVEGVKRKKFVVVLVERIAHLRILHKRMQRAGIKHAMVYGEKTQTQRQQAIDDMNLGELRVIIANRVFAKGVDIRACDVIIDATASRSKNSALQRFGRGVRLYKGKSGLLHFDVGDMAHGAASENRFTTCTRSRRRAFRQANIPALRADARLGARVLYDRAEKFLRKHVAQRAHNTTRALI